VLFIYHKSMIRLSLSIVSTIVSLFGNYYLPSFSLTRLAFVDSLSTAEALSTDIFS